MRYVEGKGPEDPPEGRGRTRARRARLRGSAAQVADALDSGARARARAPSREALERAARSAQGANKPTSPTSGSADDSASTGPGRPRAFLLGNSTGLRILLSRSKSARPSTDEPTSTRSAGGALRVPDRRGAVPARTRTSPCSGRTSRRRRRTEAEPRRPDSLPGRSTQSSPGRWRRRPERGATERAASWRGGSARGARDRPAAQAVVAAGARAPSSTSLRAPRDHSRAATDVLRPRGGSRSGPPRHAGPDRPGATNEVVDSVPVGAARQLGDVGDGYPVDDEL